MLRLEEIQKAMATLVGWEEGKGLYNDLTKSESGLRYEQAHPLLTLDNIRSILKEEDLSAVPTYDQTKEYKKGAKVKHNNIVWVAKRNVPTNNIPPSGDYNEDYNEDFTTSYWQVYDQLSEYLANAEKSAINQMVSTWITTKDIEGKSKSLLEHKVIFDGAGRKRDTITPQGNLVGLEIKNIRGIGVTTILHKLSLQMAGNDGVVEIYLFHTSQSRPLATFHCRVMPNGMCQWFGIDKFLPYRSDELQAGGSFYICYNEKDLPDGMVSVNIGKDWSKGPCPGCNPREYKSWRELTKYVEVSPFRKKVATSFKGSTPVVEDWGDVVYTATKNYGMNLEMSVVCDTTDFVIMHKDLFARALQIQVACDLLRAIAYNPNVNVNRNQLNVSRQELIADIEGNPMQYKHGLQSELKTIYKALDIDTSDMDSVCLACKKVGITYMGI